MKTADNTLTLGMLLEGGCGGGVLKEWFGKQYIDKSFLVRADSRHSKFVLRDMRFIIYALFHTYFKNELSLIILQFCSTSFFLVTQSALAKYIAASRRHHNTGWKLKVLSVILEISVFFHYSFFLLDLGMFLRF